jgi:hypothetical protein
LSSLVWGQTALETRAGSKEETRAGSKEETRAGSREKPRGSTGKPGSVL